MEALERAAAWVKEAEAHVKRRDRAGNKRKPQTLEERMVGLSKALDDQAQVVECK